LSLVKNRITVKVRFTKRKLPMSTPETVLEAHDVPVQPASKEVLLPIASDNARNVGVGIVLGVVGAILGYGRLPALGFTVYVVLLIGALFTTARWQHTPAMRRNLPILIPLLFFALMLAVRSEETLIFFNFVAGTFAALLLIYYFRSGNIAQHDLFGYALTSLLTSFAVTIQPFEELIGTRKWMAHRTFGFHALTPIIRGLLITIPVVAVFVVLLSSADEVFSKLVSDILSHIRFPALGDIRGYTVFAVVAGWTAIGGIAFALLERKGKRGESSFAAQIVPPASTAPLQRHAPIFSLGFTETTMLLGSVCGVFAAFVAIQFAYLFGGQRNIEKFSYADYLHRGFAELVIVGILTLGLAYTLNIVAIRKTSRNTNVFRGLATLLVVLTGVILMSAFQRLRLYEEAYGFTSLRLLIYVFIVWLGVLFVGFTLSLYWQPATINVFGVTTLIALFGFVATLDIINPDAFVAREMIDRNDVDPMYLVSLSDEAIPAMAMLADAPEPGLQTMVRNELWNRQKRLNKPNDLRDFSIGRAGAVAAISTVKEKLPAPVVANYSEDDFKFIKSGMNYRMIVRQLGRPYSFSGFYEDRDFSDPSTLNIQYMLATNQRVEIHIDSTVGVNFACILDKAQSSCTTKLVP
jgi:hypothetical protein